MFILVDGGNINMLIILMSITVCMWNGVNIKMLIIFP
jgi:hypothetical protein